MFRLSTIFFVGLVLAYIHGFSARLGFIDTEIVNLISDFVILAFVFFNTITSKYAQPLLLTLRQNIHITLFVIYVLGQILVSDNLFDGANEGKYFIIPFLLLLSLRGNPLPFQQHDRMLSHASSLSIVAFVFQVLNPTPLESRFGFSIVAGYGVSGMIAFVGLFSSLYMLFTLRNWGAYLYFSLTLLGSGVFMILSGARRYLVSSVILVISFFVVSILNVNTQTSGMIKRISLFIYLISFIVVVALFALPESAYDTVMVALRVGLENLDLQSGTGRLSRNGSIEEGVLFARVMDGIEMPFGHGLGQVGNSWSGTEDSGVLIDGTFNRLAYSMGIVGLILMLNIVYSEACNLIQRPTGHLQLDIFSRSLFITILALLIVEEVLFAKGPITVIIYLLSFFGNRRLFQTNRRNRVDLRCCE